MPSSANYPVVVQSSFESEELSNPFEQEVLAYSVGCRVRLEDVELQPDLEGKLGIVVRRSGKDTWLIQVDNEPDEQIFASRHLVKVQDTRPKPRANRGREARAADRFRLRSTNEKPAQADRNSRVLRQVPEVSHQMPKAPQQVLQVPQQAAQAPQARQAPQTPQTPQAPTKKQESLASLLQDMGGGTLIGFFSLACPDMTEEQLADAHTRLLSIGVIDLTSLLELLRDNQLSKKLEMVGQKLFPDDVLLRIEVLASKMRLLTSTQTQAPRVNPASPCQEFQIVDIAGACVHELPSESSTLVGTLPVDKIVVATEETFDGWVRLQDNSGWARKGSRAKDGVGIVVMLSPVGQPLDLSVPILLDTDKPQRFRACLQVSEMLGQSFRTAEALLRMTWEASVGRISFCMTR